MYMSSIPSNLFQKRLMRFTLGDEGIRDGGNISIDIARVRASLWLNGLGFKPDRKYRLV